MTIGPHPGMAVLGCPICQSERFPQGPRLGIGNFAERFGDNLDRMRFTVNTFQITNVFEAVLGEQGQIYSRQATGDGTTCDTCGGPLAGVWLGFVRGF